MRSADVLVIGAGPTGIGAAYRLQQLDADWLMVESNDTRGMAGSVTDEHGFTWDLGGHVLHSHFDTFDKAIADAGTDMLYPTRNGWIWSDATLLPTPLQHHVESMPDDLQPDAPAANLAEYYRNHLGSKLYGEFFKPFTEKMWATPLEQVDHAWTSLRNGSAERNVPSVALKQHMAAPQSVQFPYPAGGTGKLWDDLAGRLDGDRIQYGVRVDSIDLDRRTAHLSNGEVVSYNECVSSMPLTTLLTSVNRPELAERAPQFLSSQALVVGLGFEGTPPEMLADKSWLYSPDAHVSWHRATMLSNYDPANAGDGRWSILCEVGLSQFRQMNDAEAISSCQLTMAQLGASPADLVSTWSLPVEMGYPVPTLGRDDLLVELDAKLTQSGLRTRGRFGGWRYESCNQDYSFMQGVQAVDAAMFGHAEDVYWHPERS